jgi:hypothetical protein
VAKHESTPNIDVQAANAAYHELLTVDFESRSVTAVKELLKPIFRGYISAAPVFDPGLPLFGVGIGSKFESVSDLRVPPPDSLAGSLTHRQGLPFMFCSTTFESAILNAEVGVGDTVCVTEWKTTRRLAAMRIGYTESVFSALGNSSTASLPLEPETPQIGPDAHEVMQLLSSLFFLRWTHKDKKREVLTLAIAEWLLTAEAINALLYPAPHTKGDTEILIVKPAFGEECLQFVRAEIAKIEAVEERRVRFRKLNAAPELDTKGNIEWYGGGSSDRDIPKRYGTMGWQEFLNQKRDILHAYDSARNANRNRPVQTEHGNVGEAKFREWLGNFLPKKYAVAAGYIIPDVRRMNYTLRHYDVIIYDALDAPVLWASNDPDKALQGRERAIPAEHVRAVLEVKSTFTKRNITGAKAKLSELNLCQTHLRKEFVSGIVFLEVREAEQRSCAIGELLLADDIVGYFGGLVLRAEGHDPNITGYFTFLNDATTTESAMPLVREVTSVSRGTDGMLTLPNQGDVGSAIAYDDVWNFDVGYSPVVRGVLLKWAYNSFPEFFWDLIARMQGTYDPDSAGPRPLYGMSFIR